MTPWLLTYSTRYRVLPFFTEMEKNHDYNMDVEKNFDKFLKEGKWSYLENPNIEEFESFLNMKINYL
jgi:hypothetical protein